MKKVILSLVVFAAVLVSCKGKEEKKVAVKEVTTVEETVVVDGNVNMETSVVLWKGFKPTGSHHGIVKLASGNMVFADGAISGEFVIDMNTITDADGLTKLDAHLKDADFFDVEKYPTSKFVITSSEMKEGKMHVTGDLTIKDVTKSITIPATVSEVEGVTTFKSETFELNRVDFNVKYGSKSIFANLKDKFINDNMEMSFEVQSVK